MLECDWESCEDNLDNSELDDSTLVEELVGVPLASSLSMELLCWLEVSPVGVPPQADNNVGITTKNVRYISVFAHLYIDKHLRFILCIAWGLINVRQIKYAESLFLSHESVTAMKSQQFL